jgi:MtfA peptidase
MDDPAFIVRAIVLLVVLAVIIFIFLWSISSSTFGFIESIYIMIFDKPFMPHCELLYRPLDPKLEQILKLYSRYYRSLPEKKQSVFETRMVRFINNKEFLAKGDLKLTDEMVVLAAESAIKLTFGLRNYKFSEFEQIYFFKSAFYSDFSKTTNVGETNPRGVIVFSWKDLVSGDTNESDNINVGLHEFAHAYMLDNKTNEDQYFNVQCARFDDLYADKNKMESIRSQQVFIDYAFRNKMEFFAVAVEHFFETPDAMKKDIPELYGILCKMLNQDPALVYSSTIPHRRTE